MKRMNRLVIAMPLAFLMLSSFQIGIDHEPEFQDAKTPKKVEAIQIKVNNNGKAVTIDTTFINLSDKAVQAKVDSILKSKNISVKAGMPGNVMVFESGDSKGEATRKHMTIQVMVDDSGKQKVTRKIITGTGKDGEVIVLDGERLNFQIPPAPPVPHTFDGSGNVMIRRVMPDPFAFNPSDPDIISYDRKDIGKDREKITIVRRKKTGVSTTHSVKVVEGMPAKGTSQTIVVEGKPISVEEKVVKK